MKIQTWYGNLRTISVRSCGYASNTSLACPFTYWRRKNGDMSGGGDVEWFFSSCPGKTEPSYQKGKLRSLLLLTLAVLFLFLCSQNLRSEHFKEVIITSSGATFFQWSSRFCSMIRQKYKPPAWSIALAVLLLMNDDDWKPKQNTLHNY